jgi:hypothetical protein
MGREREGGASALLPSFNPEAAYRRLEVTLPIVVLSSGFDRRHPISRLGPGDSSRAWLGVVSLIIFYVVRGPFGFINNVANGLMGLLSIASAGGPVIRQRGFAPLDGNVLALPRLVPVARPSV